MKNIYLSIVFGLVSGACCCGQSYRFQVVRMELQAWVQPDASLRLQYEIEFRNAPGAHAIDVVDVGLPHPRYQLSSMTASIDDRPLRSIQRSSYIDVGVEVDLQQHAIPPGRKGIFRFECVMPDMVFADTTDSKYASVQIRPTWFDPELQIGTTVLKVAIHVPPGIAAADLVYQDESQRYTDLVDGFGEGDAAHAVAIWEAPQHQLSAGNPKYSLSFPRQVMQRVVQKSSFDLLIEWFGGNLQIQLWSGGLLLGLLAFVFFRFSHGTGFVVFAVLAGILVFTMISSPGLHLCCWPLLLGITALNEWFLTQRRRPTYLPAMATVEGGGIKRGLTAPQAAVLLELPLPKVLTMVVFGLLKKGALQLQASDPAAVTVLPDYRTTRDRRLQVAAGQGMVMHDYEQPFLDRLMQHDGPVETCDLNEAMGGLVRSVAQRMKGFDMSATREYYQRIVKRAFTEAESIGEIKQRDETVERNFEWMMMDPDWTVILADWHRRGYDYYPRWTRTTSPSSVPMGAPSGGSPQPSSSPGSAPTLGEVAGSFAGWTENTAGRFASMLEPAAMGLDLSGRGIIDLSGVDRITGDVFEALAESAAEGGRGGGGGCACACAGCACACACAGGGR